MDYMNLAVNEAKKALEQNEVPVGCVIVSEDGVIAASHNTTEENSDCTCHAEMNAIKAAFVKTGEKYLDKCEMYVTLEPCAMCTGAIINSRIKRVYIGAPEPRTGCCGTAANIVSELKLKIPEIYIGIHEEECGKIMKNFFESKR